MSTGLVAGAVADAKSGNAQISPERFSPAATGNRCPVPDRYRRAFEAAERDTNLPLSLLVSMARVESNLDQSAVSSAGARGLLQVMPPTAGSFRLNPDRPGSNVLAGARYLKTMMSHFDSADLALAAYNAGADAVQRAGGAPGGETMTYVANVNRLWQRLQGCS